MPFPDARPLPGRVAVLLPLPLKGAYDYAVPDGMTVQPGSVVEVPLGPRLIPGVVWGEGEGTVEAARLKPIARVFDVPPLVEVGRKFIDWVAAYTVTPPGQVLRMTLSARAAFDGDRGSVAYRRSGAAVPPGFRMTPARRAVLERLPEGALLPMAALTAAGGASPGTSPAVVRGLAEAGLLEAVAAPLEAPVAEPDWRRAGPVLGADQQEAAATLAEAVGAGGYRAILLDGVTGSGKTEVYFEAVAACLAAGRQALVLLPEIALGAQWLQRFEARFGVRPGAWHSELGPAQRRRTWRAVALGAERVVVGARSALFLPFPALGLIVVDEEHEPAYKQEDGVLYHARDMAVVRAFLGGLPVVLASATPSLETLANVEAGRYRRVVLPARHGGAVLPEVKLIDLREDRPEARSWLAPSLRRAVAETLAAGEQAMLFLNRRGYAPLTLCRGCGHRLQCPHCSAWLVEHRLIQRLQCHHCGFAMPLAERCPECKKEGLLAACGPGVERIAEEVAATFPEARAAVFTSDTLGGPQAVADLVRRILDREMDILIGTQVLAKGHHFPLLTLVGVVDADLGLAGGDLRAAERTFQLLHQVSGRAGRAERPGRVLLQSCMPEHPVMQALAAGDRDRFNALEADERRSWGWPPYGRLVALIVSGEDAPAVERVAQDLGRTAPRTEHVEVLGPAPAPLALLRGRHRKRLLLKAPRGVAVQPLVTGWLAKVACPASVSIQVDVDPFRFL